MSGGATLHGGGRACALCGTPCPPPFRAPAPELAPDLDLRPGEPTRSTLPRWIATCRGCGAAAPDLAALPETARATVASPAYRALSGPRGTLPFLRWALLQEAAGDPDGAAESVLQAAWAADDAEDMAAAAALRRRAAGLWGDPADPATALRLIDVLRRAGEFEAASARAVSVGGLALDESSARIVAFQQARIAERDTTRQMMSSALRPPARTPHVGHGKRERRGLWDRLFGG